MRLELMSEFDYEQALDYLATFSKQGAPITDLSRFSALCGELGNPENGLRCIHIVGTNGKGSVTEYISAALCACGFRTIRFTSPYILDVRERITLDGEFIPKDVFARLIFEVKSAAERCRDRAFSQFEILTAVCFLFARESGADYCVLEAGIGGTLDCTNVIPCPEAAVFTSIGLDHTAILGKTEREIAVSKSGIIKGGAVIAANNIPAEAMAVIEGKCSETHSRLVVPDAKALEVRESGLCGSRFIYKGEEYSLSMCGNHQITNALTALETLFALREKLPLDRVKAALKTAVMPARLERINLPEKPAIILDGGHNPQAMAAARELLMRDKRKKTALIGMINTKDFALALSIILPCFDFAVFYDGFSETAVSAELLCAEAKRVGTPCAGCHSAEEALSEAISRTHDSGLLFIGGSFYMAAGIREMLLG